MEGILGRIVAVVLGLLALAGVGLAGYNAFGTNRASQVTADMEQVITNARSQFSQGSNGYTNFTTANEATLITAGIFPSDMVTSGGTVQEAWGTTVGLGPANGGTQATIVFGPGGSETVAQCSSVATNLKDYVSLKVGTTTFTQSTPPDAVTAATACTGGQGITITFQ